MAGLLEILGRAAGNTGIIRKYVIIGPQGSGKGTQSALLAKDLDLVHITVDGVIHLGLPDQEVRRRAIRAKLGLPSAEPVTRAGG